MEEISPNNLLKVSHISASYQEGKQRKTVLHDISFELHENEILGLVGESGCGKSTLSKVILGFIRPDEGEIFSRFRYNYDVMILTFCRRYQSLFWLLQCMVIACCLLMLFIR